MRPNCCEHCTSKTVGLQHERAFYRNEVLLETIFIINVFEMDNVWLSICPNNLVWGGTTLNRVEDKWFIYLSRVHHTNT